MLLICLFLFPPCFGQVCAHHQKNLLYQCDNWYMSLCVRGLLEKYPTFGREKETGLLGALDT